MKAGMRTVVIAGLVLVGCGTPPDPRPTNDNSSAATMQTLTQAEQLAACPLLDDPNIRPLLDGLEMKLMLLCGRVSLPRPDLGAGDRLPWQAAPLGREGLGEDLGGIDIAVSNPALDVGGTTESETSVVA